MPRYSGYGYGGTPVQGALRDTAGILGEGIRDVGQGRLRSSELGLKREMQERQMAREGIADTRAAETYGMQKPGMQVASEKNAMELADLNAPVSIGTFARDPSSLQHIIDVPEGEKESLAEKIGGMFGAKIDVDPKSATYGKYLKPDGGVLLNKELRQRGGEVSDMILANTNVAHSFEDQLTRQHEALSKNPELLKTPQGQKLQQSMMNTMKWLNDPALQLKTLEKQRSVLSRVKGPEFEKAIARIDKQIDTITGTLTKKEERIDKRSLELEKLGIEERGKKERAEEHNKVLKSIAETRADASTVGKTPKLAPTDQAGLDSLKGDEKTNNDSIKALRVEKFRALDPGSRKEIEAEIASISKENDKIKKRITNFGKAIPEEEEQQPAPQQGGWKVYQEGGPFYRGKIKR